ncbi:response regulator [Proteinivorax tanatarense]|uniref:Stage 0 sporulation protein A homolog n=1 Tax=Proteinivorax tanatarense TaxID=1260629 RepID=A0AAU7VMW3_9FIRM
MSKKYNVLFVDDEVNVLNSIKRGLIDEDYNCLFASSGKEALEIMAENEISVIVSDMRMPKMDGLKLLKEVSKQSPETVKIILSGYTQLQQILTTINQVDVFKFITKPWKMESEFKVIINQALDYYKTIEENKRIKDSLEKQNEAYRNMFSSLSGKIKLQKRNNEVLQWFIDANNAFVAKKLGHDKEVLESIIDIQKKIYQQLIENFAEDAGEMEVGKFVSNLEKDLEEKTKLVKHAPEGDKLGQKKIENHFIVWVVQGILTIITEKSYYKSYMTIKQDTDNTSKIQVLFDEKENNVEHSLSYEVRKEMIEDLIQAMPFLEGVLVDVQKQDKKVVVEILLK